MRGTRTLRAIIPYAKDKAREKGKNVRMSFFLLGSIQIHYNSATLSLSSLLSPPLLHCQAHPDQQGWTRDRHHPLAIQGSKK